MYATWAESLAESLLAKALPDRWAHSRAVGLKSRELRELAGAQADVLEAAAFLHDIGYAPAVRVTGFHPLDGARHLRDETDAPALLCTLVANHTGAAFEADGRGHGADLSAEFPVGEEPEPLLVAAITHCDLCVGPTGQATGPETRIAEILTRYPADHVVHRSVQRARSTLLAQSARVLAELG